MGIDRFMSEARAVTNFTGNAVATLLIGRWTRQIDSAKVRAVLSGDRPYLESMLTGTDGHSSDSVPTTAKSSAATTLTVEDSERQPVRSR